MKKYVIKDGHGKWWSYDKLGNHWKNNVSNAIVYNYVPFQSEFDEAMFCSSYPEDVKIKEIVPSKIITPQNDKTRN